MTARDILRDTIRRMHAQGYQYIPDPEGFDAMSRLLNDEWDTRKEFEARGGGDCDGWVGWCIEVCEEAEAALPHAAGDVPATWYAIAGRVKRNNQWLGHMWVGLVEGGVTFWADPTWNLGPVMADALGWPDTRRPDAQWRYNGWGQFGNEERYGT